MIISLAQAAGAAAPSAPAATHDLAAVVCMRLDVWVSPPLNAVPGPLLGSAGGLLLRLLLQVRGQDSNVLSLHCMRGCCMLAQCLIHSSSELPAGFPLHVCAAQR